MSEGAPIGFIWWAMPTILRNMEVEVEKITSITALLVFPWIFKFLWAPLVDTLRSKKHGFRTWIFISQLVMGLALVPLLFISPATNLTYWIICLIIHSLAAATQDVAIDAMVINNIESTERGILNGYMQAGMLTGRSVFGGGALIMIPSLGLNIVMLLLIICVVITMILLLFVKEPEFTKQTESRTKEVFTNLKTAFSNKNTWIVLFFALTSAAAFEVAGGLAGPFLTDLKVSEAKVGFFFLVPVVLSMLLGGLIGGRFSDRHNRNRSVRTFLIGFVACVFLLGSFQLLKISSDPTPYYILYTAMYFFVGMFTTSSYALFMDQTNPKIGATQFSTYMAATNGCESWTVWAAGKITGTAGYSYAFLVMGIISLLSLFLLKKIRNN